MSKRTTGQILYELMPGDATGWMLAFGLISIAMFAWVLLAIPLSYVIGMPLTFKELCQ